MHGDLTGNVLFAVGLPPAIIDFSPYWRPVAYAEAVAAVDGALWFDAGAQVLPLAETGRLSVQLLARALIFRLVALNERSRFDPTVVDEMPLVTATVDTVERLLGSGPL